MADSAPLAPNRIHSLPVLVRYHLPNSSQHFTTLFTAPQQVYVHPSAGGQGEEAWGSIYLKTVVQGVLMASPELHPIYTSTTDLSLYILDPRETYLKKSRQSPFPAQSSSSSSYAPSSPIPSPSNPEVWTGKGLISWALEEPGEGKNLITGRLTRQLGFALVSNTSSSSSVNPMEALAMMGDMPSWGIEVSLGLKSGNTPFPAPSAGLGIRSHVSNVVAMDQASSRRSSPASDKERTYGSSPLASTSYIPPSAYPAPPRHAQSLPYRTPIHPPIQPAVRPARPLSPSRVVASTQHTKARDVVAAPAIASRPDTTLKKAASNKRKKPTNDRNRPRASSGRGRPSARPSSSAPGGSSDSEPFPDDIPAKLYDDPESLTKEQAERLLESPAFLSMLSKLTGQPIAGTDQGVATGRKRPRGADERGDPTKRVKVEPGVEGAKEKEKEKEGGETSLKCYNCGRTKSAVWRMKVMDDGKSVKVCNACGLYWNKMRTMRPPPLWEGVDEEVMRKPRDEDDAEKRASRIDHAGPSSTQTPRPIPASSPAPGSGFKRTLSTVVNQDAMRIAAMKTTARPGPSALKQSFKPGPMTSPVKSASTLPAVRNAKWNNTPTAAASSPGGWVQHPHPPVPPSDDFNPLHSSPRRSARVNAAVVQESPNTAIRRILGTANTSIQSLDLPLSDDSPNDTPQPGAQPVQMLDWTNADLSSFFDVEGYAMHNASAAAARSAAGGSNAGGRATSEKAEMEDDVMSQLFNRTSSAIMSNSSPAPFDFSQLPPSSPPRSIDLPHSALLLSSPDLSPMDQRVSPAKSTGKSFTPHILSNASTPFDQGHFSQGHDQQWEGGFNSAAFGLDDLWGMDSATMVGTSSVGQAEGMLDTPGKMGEDIFAMFDKPYNQV